MQTEVNVEEVVKDRSFKVSRLKSFCFCAKVDTDF